MMLPVVVRCVVGVFHIPMNVVRIMWGLGKMTMGGRDGPSFSANPVYHPQPLSFGIGVGEAESQGPGVAVGSANRTVVGAEGPNPQWRLSGPELAVFPPFTAPLMGP
jgi:hypothetical protein